MTGSRGLLRILVGVGYVLAFLVVLGLAARSSDLAAGLVFAIGIAAPMFYVERQLLRRVNSGRPEHIVAMLRKGQPVRLTLSRASSSAWDPAHGLFGRVSGPGVAEYQLVGDSSVRFRYQGRWGKRDATTSIPPILVTGTPEATRFAATKHRLWFSLFAFYVLLPAAFVIGYFASGGSSATRAGHGSVGVLVALVLYVIATRVVGFVLVARRSARWPRRSNGSPMS